MANPQCMVAGRRAFRTRPEPPLSVDHAWGFVHGWLVSDAPNVLMGGTEEHKRILIVINTSLIVIKYSLVIDTLLQEP